MMDISHSNGDALPLVPPRRSLVSFAAGSLEDGGREASDASTGTAAPSGKQHRLSGSQESHTLSSTLPPEQNHSVQQQQQEGTRSKPPPAQHSGIASGEKPHHHHQHHHQQHPLPPLNHKQIMAAALAAVAERAAAAIAEQSDDDLIKEHLLPSFDVEGTTATFSSGVDGAVAKILAALDAVCDGASSPEVAATLKSRVQAAVAAGNGDSSCGSGFGADVSLAGTSACTTVAGSDASMTVHRGAVGEGEVANDEHNASLPGGLIATAAASREHSIAGLVSGGAELADVQRIAGDDEILSMGTNAAAQERISTNNMSATVTAGAFPIPLSLSPLMPAAAIRKSQQDLTDSNNNSVNNNNNNNNQTNGNSNFNNTTHALSRSGDDLPQRLSLPPSAVTDLLLLSRDIARDLSDAAAAVIAASSEISESGKRARSSPKTSSTDSPKSTLSPVMTGTGASTTTALTADSNFGDFARRTSSAGVSSQSSGVTTVCHNNNNTNNKSNNNSSGHQQLLGGTNNGPLFAKSNSLSSANAFDPGEATPKASSCSLPSSSSLMQHPATTSRCNSNNNSTSNNVTSSPPPQMYTLNTRVRSAGGNAPSSASGLVGIGGAPAYVSSANLRSQRTIISSTSHSTHNPPIVHLYQQHQQQQQQPPPSPPLHGPSGHGGALMMFATSRHSLSTTDDEAQDYVRGLIHNTNNNNNLKHNSIHAGNGAGGGADAFNARSSNSNSPPPPPVASAAAGSPLSLIRRSAAAHSPAVNRAGGIALDMFPSHGEQQQRQQMNSDNNNNDNNSVSAASSSLRPSSAGAVGIVGSHHTASNPGGMWPSSRASSITVADAGILTHNFEALQRAMQKQHRQQQQQLILALLESACSLNSLRNQFSVFVASVRQDRAALLRKIRELLCANVKSMSESTSTTSASITPPLQTVGSASHAMFANFAAFDALLSGQRSPAPGTGLTPLSTPLARSQNADPANNRNNSVDSSSNNNNNNRTFERKRFDSVFDNVHTEEIAATNVVVEEQAMDGTVCVNQYVLLATIGEGSQAPVMLANNTETGQMVAIKIVPRPKISANNPHSALMRTARRKIKMMRREVAAMKRCRHKNIVRLMECIDDENSGSLFLVMEYLERGAAARHCTDELQTSNGDNMFDSAFDACASNNKYLSEPSCINRRYTAATVIRFGRKLLSALQYIHDLGVCHRDLNVANVLVSADGEPKISDFGIVTLESHTDTSRHNPNSMHSPSNNLDDSNALCYSGPAGSVGGSRRIVPALASQYHHSSGHNATTSSSVAASPSPFQQGAGIGFSIPSSAKDSVSNNYLMMSDPASAMSSPGKQISLAPLPHPSVPTVLVQCGTGVFSSEDAVDMHGDSTSWSQQQQQPQQSPFVTPRGEGESRHTYSSAHPQLLSDASNRSGEGGGSGHLPEAFLERVTSRSGGARSVENSISQHLPKILPPDQARRLSLMSKDGAGPTADASASASANRLAQFGVARQPPHSRECGGGGAGGEKRRQSMVQGTVAYSAPELHAPRSYPASNINSEMDVLKDNDGPEPIDLFQADCFSMGLTLYVMLYGRLPWRAAPVYTYLQNLVQRDVPFPPAWQPGDLEDLGEPIDMGLSMGDSGNTDGNNSPSSSHHQQQQQQQRVASRPPLAEGEKEEEDVPEEQYPQELLDILRGMLHRDPMERLTVEEARLRLKALEAKTSTTLDKTGSLFGTISGGDGEVSAWTQRRVQRSSSKPQQQHHPHQPSASAAGGGAGCPESW